ncbi:MAG TPA: hypothetical protein VNR00_10495 [Opitutus sp.]|nr:hypothetical protein [Opitutus sp.]
MPAPAGVNELAARKRLLLAEADLHRGILQLERERLCARGQAARATLAQHRWWLLGGAAVVGFLLTRRARGLAAWLPTVLSVGRSFLR